MPRSLVVRCALAAGSLLLVCASSDTQELPTIRVAGPAQEGFKTVYYGVQASIFRKYGLNVEIVPVTSGAAALAALAGGSIEVALTSMVPFLQAYARGLPFEIVALGQLYESEFPTNELFVAAGSPARSGRDLDGKTVAVQSIKDLNWAATLDWIDGTGGDSQTVKVIELPVGAVIPALEDGRIDAATISAPYLEQAAVDQKLRLLAKNFDVIGKRFEAAVYIATRAYVETNRDTMTRFARAMQEAAVYVNTHPQETIGLIAAFTGVPAERIARAARTHDPDYVDARDIQPLIDLSVKYKLIDHSISVGEIVAPTALRSEPLRSS